MSKLRKEFTRVGPLSLYHETLGKGRPLLLLHAGFSSIDTSFGKLRPALARRHRTIAVEQQAHGHTADAARPLSYVQMVEDTAALLRKRKVKAADVFGWSDGGIVALGLAIKYPRLVRRVALCGAGYSPQAEGPEFKRMLAHMPPDNPHLKPFRDAYEKVAPDPKNWPVMIEKVKAMYHDFRGWPKARLRTLKAPLLVMLGDRDFVRLEHAIELFRLVPHGRLAVLPASDHAAPLARREWVTAMLEDFFGHPAAVV